jgi:hypothetical protein
MVPNEMCIASVGRHILAFKVADDFHDAEHADYERQ